MVVIASTGKSNDMDIILNLRDFLEIINRDYQIDTQDFVKLMLDAAENYPQYPELRDLFDNVQGMMNEHVDMLASDDLYNAEYELRNIQEEIRAEIDALRSTSRKNNTKADIARRLENIVSNMDYIF